MNTDLITRLYAHPSGKAAVFEAIPQPRIADEAWSASDDSDKSYVELRLTNTRGASSSAPPLVAPGTAKQFVAYFDSNRQLHVRDLRPATSTEVAGTEVACNRRGEPRWIVGEEPSVIGQEIFMAMTNLLQFRVVIKQHIPMRVPWYMSVVYQRVAACTVDEQTDSSRWICTRQRDRDATASGLINLNNFSLGANGEVWARGPAARKSLMRWSDPQSYTRNGVEAMPIDPRIWREILRRLYEAKLRQPRPQPLEDSSSC